MSTYSIYFSPTGGTENVMHILGAEFSSEKKIDLTKDMDFSTYVFGEEDICLVGVPSYGGRVPEIAIKRIKQLKGNGAKAVVVAVYGNRAFEDTLLELKHAMEQSNFHIVAGIAANAEHSILHQFGAGRPDGEDRRELQKFSKSILEKIKNIKNGHEKESLQIPGNFPYKEFGGLPLKPRANKKCNQCGLCAAKCPVGALSKEKSFVPDETKCISCMRCVSICPQKARSLNKLILWVVSKKMEKAYSKRKKNELFI